VTPEGITTLPRLRLAHLPTPLERMPRLGAALGLSSLWVKRDDCTGLGIGGNKIRKLEFCLAAAQAENADCIVCGGVVQSNTARQVAAACAKLGIECHLAIMRGRLSITEPTYETSGNILLDRLYGASDARGAMGYVLAAQEIISVRPDTAYIVHASGSAGTQAGLLAGLLALDHPARIIGIDVDAQPKRLAADIRRVGREAAALLGIERRWPEDRIEVAAAFSAGAYGIADVTTEEAIRLAARTEALTLDPVYAGKGMAGLIGLARRGRFDPDETIVWIHTGGLPGIFAYPDTMARVSSEEEAALPTYRLHSR